MTDQTIPADKVRRARQWARDTLDDVENGANVSAYARDAARTLIAMMPRPTLADMTPDEQDECAGMQADLAQGDRVVILDGTPDHDGRVQVLESSLDVYRPVAALVTPRPDLPSMTWPGDKKPDPAPALPGRWRLADHPEHGRVIVTNPTPDPVGDVYFVFPNDDDIFSRGYGWHACDPAELTYIDKEGDTTTGQGHIAVGTVIKSADDPRIAALPLGSILLGSEGDPTVKRRSGWTGVGYVPNESERDEFGPWTVLHIPKEADQ